MPCKHSTSNPRPLSVCVSVTRVALSRPQEKSQSTITVTPSPMAPSVRFVFPNSMHSLSLSVDQAAPHGSLSQRLLAGATPLQRFITLLAQPCAIRAYVNQACGHHALGSPSPGTVQTPCTPSLAYHSAFYSHACMQRRGYATIGCIGHSPRDVLGEVLTPRNPSSPHAWHVRSSDTS